jgi:hypothetical protein
MVGNRQEAEIAAKFDAEDMRTLLMNGGYNYETGSYAPTPIPDYDGWFVIGKGSTRVALLSPSKVTYKIHLYSGGRFNQREIGYRNSLPDRMKTCRVADATLYDIDVIPVLAMEYISLPFYTKNNSYTEMTSIENECMNYGIYDIHEGNLGRDKDGTPVLIDYAG